MEQTYDTLTTMLRNILEPLPANQEGVPDYCRRMLLILRNVRYMIEDLEKSYEETIEEFSGI